MTFNLIKTMLKTSIRSTLIMSLIAVAMATGSCVTALQPISQDHTMYTSTGLRLTLGHQTLGRQIEFFTISGRPVRLIQDATGCVILRIDGQDFRSWHQVRPYTRQLLLQTRGLAYYQNLELKLYSHKLYSLQSSQYMWHIM